VGRAITGFNAFVEGNGSNALKGETMADKTWPHVVIVGGGFGGLAAACS
jgi:NADPH-dependent 2,4-dienoyl-CoA reductase/sulfur reductase-like enzyme